MARERSRRTRRKVWPSVLLFLAVGLVVGASAFGRLAHQEEPADVAHRISTAQGLVVDFGSPRNFKLPSHPNSEIFSNGLSADATDAEHADAALRGIERALESYPTGFVAKLVRAIFICGVLHAKTARASGMLGSHWILIAAPPDRSADDVRAMSTATLHHELSSAVLRREGALALWSQYWPATQPELHNFNQVTAQNAAERPDPSTGFLSAFAMTNPENDFNVYAEEVFLHPIETVRLAASNPIVRKKLNTFVSLYTALDPRMAPQFQALGVTPPAN